MKAEEIKVGRSYRFDAMPDMKVIDIEQGMVGYEPFGRGIYRAATLKDFARLAKEEVSS